MRDEVTHINRNGSSRIDITSDPIELFIIDEPILLAWGISSTSHQYSKPFAIVEYMSQEMLSRFKEASSYLGVNNLNDSSEYIKGILQLFPDGEYSISKKSSIKHNRE